MSTDDSTNGSRREDENDGNPRPKKRAKLLAQVHKDFHDRPIAMPLEQFLAKYDEPRSKTHTRVYFAYEFSRGGSYHEEYVISKKLLRCLAEEDPVLDLGEVNGKYSDVRLNFSSVFDHDDDRLSKVGDCDADGIYSEAILTMSFTHGGDHDMELSGEVLWTIDSHKTEIAITKAFTRAVGVMDRHTCRTMADWYALLARKAEESMGDDADDEDIPYTWDRCFQDEPDLKGHPDEYPSDPKASVNSKPVKKHRLLRLLRKHITKCNKDIQDCVDNLNANTTIGKFVLKYDLMDEFKATAYYPS